MRPESARAGHLNPGAVDDPLHVEFNRNVEMSVKFVGSCSFTLQPRQLISQGPLVYCDCSAKKFHIVQKLVFDFKGLYCYQ